MSNDQATPDPAGSADATQEILGVVAGLITSVVGEDELLGIEIGATTSFADDLELESIEFVSLAEEIKQHYGDRVDFVEFLASKELEEIMALTVGDLVEHIAVSLAGTDPRG